MIVIDASVVVALLTGNLDPEQLGDEEFAAPHLLDSEVTNALRRLVLRGLLTEPQGQAAMDGFVSLALTRYAAHALRRRMWELRHNRSAYDATYLALAERTGASALLTTDARLAEAPGARCPVQVVSPRKRIPGPLACRPWCIPTTQAAPFAAR
jgi:predicted nucleic acid-binding protein